MKVEHYINTEYAYSEAFWGADKNRAYENEADQMMIRNAVRGETSWLADFGGGFGRLVPVLKEYAKRVIIVDASMDLLNEAKATFGADPTVFYVRANLYHLPFKNQSIERAVCMRVMHHIGDVDVLFTEFQRVIRTALYLEFPNKKHLLQRLRFYFRHDTKVDIHSDVPEIRDQMYFNFTLAFMRTHLKAVTTFSVQRVMGASFLRHKQLKRLPLGLLRVTENMLQHIAQFVQLAPSIFLVLQKKTTEPEQSFVSPLEILVCPLCVTSLHVHNDTLTCAAGHVYYVHNEIFDLFVE